MGRVYTQELADTEADEWRALIKPLVLRMHDRKLVGLVIEKDGTFATLSLYREGDGPPAAPTGGK